MLNSTENRPDRDAERKARLKARRRAEQAAIVEGLRTALDEDEQLLAFARGRLAGGWRGKLLVGPEAFFAPYVNIGLTERRLVLQHIHPENGRPSEILPHFFPLAEIAALVFTDIETFGAEPACRLILRLNGEQHFRLRLDGATNFENARAMAEVFQSLTSARRSATRPTQSVCATCGHVLDQPFKFCPYCGQPRADAQPEPISESVAETAPPSPVEIAPEPPAPPAPTVEAAAPAPEAPIAPEMPSAPVAPAAWNEATVTETPEAPPAAPAPEPSVAATEETSMRPRAAERIPEFALPETPVPSVPPFTAAPPVPEASFAPVIAPAPPVEVAVPAPEAPVTPPAPTGWIEAPTPEVPDAALLESPPAPEAEASPATDRYEQPTSEPLSDALAETPQAETAPEPAELASAAPTPPEATTAEAAPSEPSSTETTNGDSSSSGEE